MEIWIKFGSSSRDSLDIWDLVDFSLFPDDGHRGLYTSVLNTLGFFSCMISNLDAYKNIVNNVGENC